MNKRIIAAHVLLALLGFACSSGNSQEQEVVEEKQIMVKDLSTVEYDHVFEEERPFAQSHASTIIDLDQGYLLAWFAGSLDGASDKDAVEVVEREEERARDEDAVAADRAGLGELEKRGLPAGYEAPDWPGVSFDPALDAVPSSFRGTPVTSVIDAAPQGIWHLTGPSYVPILTALGVTLVALGPIVSSYWLSGIGAALAVVSLVRWLWPTVEDRERVLAERQREDYEDAPDLPAYAKRLEGQSTSEPGLWGVSFFLVSAAIVYATVFFAYFYLRLYSDAWPQGGISLPELALPAATGVLLLLSAWPAFAATRAIRRGNTRGLSNWLGVSVLLGAGFLGLHIWNVARAGFVPALNGYATVFHAIAGLVTLMTVLALGIQFAVWLRSLRGHFDSQYDGAAQHAGLVWWFTVAANVLAYGVLYLGPRVAGGGL